MKHLLIRTCIAATAVLFVAAEGRAELIDGLISYWPFDNSLDDVAPANNGNDGTYVGASPLEYGTGKFGDAIDLDGAGGRNYVDVADDPSTQIEMENGGDGNISISAWFTVDSFTKSWQALIAKGEGTSWRIARRDVANIMSYAGGVGDIPTDATTGPDVNDGEFHHVVAITEQGVSTRLWVDGTLVATGGAPTLTVNAVGDNANIRIGDNPDTTEAVGRSWDGRIDDVGIWSRVLTEDEILGLWNGGDGTSINDSLGVPGDVNGDEVADIDDFNIISMNFGQSPAARDEGNIAGGPDVNLADFRAWKANRTAAVAAGGAVPEPAGIALAVCGLITGLGAYRRRRTA